MKKEFIPYEEALALKELGFDEECLGSYMPTEPPHFQFACDDDYYISAPLYQQAFRWFRENHKLVAEIQAPDGLNGVWHPTIHKVHGFGNHYDNDGFATYEEAELACLRKLIELLGDSPDESGNSTNANSDNTNG